MSEHVRNENHISVIIACVDRWHDPAYQLLWFAYAIAVLVVTVTRNYHQSLTFSTDLLCENSTLQVLNMRKLLVRLDLQ